MRVVHVVCDLISVLFRSPIWHVINIYNTLTKLKLYLHLHLYMYLHLHLCNCLHLPAQLNIGASAHKMKFLIAGTLQNSFNRLLFFVSALPRLLSGNLQQDTGRATAGNRRQQQLLPQTDTDQPQCSSFMWTSLGLKFSKDVFMLYQNFPCLS